jgi:thiol-disulfide isomerase/thioredoxin
MNFKPLLIVAVLLGFFLLGCTQNGTENVNNTLNTQLNSTQEVHVKTVEVHFYYSPTCPHCLEVKPYVQALAKNTTVKIDFCNVKEVIEGNYSACSNESLKYIYSVRGVPTAVIVMDNETYMILEGSKNILKLGDVLKCLVGCKG